MTPADSAVGPPIGGALAQRGWWRWLFFLNVPVCAIALLLNMIYLRPDAPRGSLWDKLSQMDIMSVDRTHLVPLRALIMYQP